MTVNTIMSMQIRQCSASTTSCDKLFFSTSVRVDFRDHFEAHVLVIRFSQMLSFSQWTRRTSFVLSEERVNECSWNFCSVC